jgi:hypothetical protein
MTHKRHHPSGTPAMRIPSRIRLPSARKVGWSLIRRMRRIVNVGSRSGPHERRRRASSGSRISTSAAPRWKCARGLFRLVCGRPVKWSAYRSRPEVTGRLSKRRFWHDCDTRFLVSRSFCPLQYMWCWVQRSTARRSPRTRHSPSALSQSAWG